MFAWISVGDVKRITLWALGNSTKDVIRYPWCRCAFHRGTKVTDRFSSSRRNRPLKRFTKYCHHFSNCPIQMPIGVVSGHLFRPWVTKSGCPKEQMQVVTLTKVRKNEITTTP
jgi:hypothetical protein